ncbi:hypothetical protein DLAC_10920 [Tieghemostelium lacteum]|uniref:Uncharacterized protein n=1 Tax=Tieghemostelium lacteum TaxID=361077 RepID=A0A151Z2P8_TIELA|nr:hypothetical protein DLAC_10920 [Tieghemostelium lacteum]|eukprot:KYQ88235.1 hypothetical protein DLAC_10920 [Tieghemostelium lacteum]
MINNSLLIYISFIFFRIFITSASSVIYGVSYDLTELIQIDLMNQSFTSSNVKLTSQYIYTTYGIFSFNSENNDLLISYTLENNIHLANLNINNNEITDIQSFSAVNMSKLITVGQYQYFNESTQTALMSSGYIYNEQGYYDAGLVKWDFNEKSSKFIYMDQLDTSQNYCTGTIGGINYETFYLFYFPNGNPSLLEYDLSQSKITNDNQIEFSNSNVLGSLSTLFPLYSNINSGSLFFIESNETIVNLYLSNNNNQLKLIHQFPSEYYIPPLPYSLSQDGSTLFIFTCNVYPLLSITNYNLETLSIISNFNISLSSSSEYKTYMFLTI